MDGKTRIITIATFAFLGVYSITCGSLYPKYQEAKMPKTSFLLVEQRQVGIKKEVSLKLKEISSEVNMPLSVNVSDYLEEPVEDDILSQLKLDTSTVNVQQPGEYIYTVYYKKKSFQGKVLVKEKPAPEVVVQIYTLKSISVPIGTPVSQDVAYYVVQAIPDEVRNAMILHIENVNPDVPNSYVYSIEYNGLFYQGTYVVFNPNVNQEQSQGQTGQTGQQEGVSGQGVTP